MPLEDIRAGRIKKLERLKALGREAYPASVKRTFVIDDAVKGFSVLVESKKEISIVGRLMAWREHGGATFGDLRDGSGTIQIYFSKEDLRDAYDEAIELVDIGDFLEVTGAAYVTKRGEPTVKVSEWRMISKSLRPLPEKWHGLVDIEERLRRRYLDLLMSAEEREIFIKKSKFWQAAREFMLSENFLEVETPVLEQIPGGADAEPFATHLNALNIDLYLRISLELPLKRLIVGGYEKVFEIGRIFRNEGIDREHLQDYTQLECYWAYADYNQMMELVARMYKQMISAALGSLQHEWNGENINWDGNWPIIEYADIFKTQTGLDPVAATEGQLKSYAKTEHLAPEAHQGKGRLIDLIFKKMVLPTLIRPSFLVNPPVEIEPLAKRHRASPDKVERFQVVACATELGKGFSELNDPVDQRTRFEEQMKLRAAGDTEAQRLDEDFIEALEYGMPPTAGFGLSERLFSVIMNRPVRETVFFPLMRPSTAAQNQNSKIKMQNDNLKFKIL